MRALYEKVENPTKQEFKTNICMDNPKVYPKKFEDLEGMKELLNMFHLYNIKGLKVNHDELKKEIEKFKELINENFKDTTGVESTTNSLQNSNSSKANRLSAELNSNGSEETIKNLSSNSSLSLESKESNIKTSSNFIDE